MPVCSQGMEGLEHGGATSLVETPNEFCRRPSVRLLWLCQPWQQARHHIGCRSMLKCSKDTHLECLELLHTPLLLGALEVL